MVMVRNALTPDGMQMPYTWVEIASAGYHGCYFPSGPDGHLAPWYAISRLRLRRAADKNCGRRHGGYMIIRAGVEVKTAV